MADVTAPPGRALNPCLRFLRETPCSSVPSRPIAKKRIRHLAELDLGGNRRGESRPSPWACLRWAWSAATTWLSSDATAPRSTGRMVAGRKKGGRGSRAGSTRTRWPRRWLTVLEHSGARFVIAGDQEQVDKAIEVQERLHQIGAHHLARTARGLREIRPHGDCIRWRPYRPRGAPPASGSEKELAAREAELDYDSTCVMLYTSGTTANRKGVVAVEPQRHRGVERPRASVDHCGESDGGARLSADGPGVEAPAISSSRSVGPTGPDSA